MSLWEIYKAKRLGYADDLWTSLIGHQLGGYSWLSGYETTPYLYRAMPNLSHYYNREIMEEVIGGSVGWNQIALAYSRTHSSGVVITSDTDGMPLLNGTASSSDSSATIVNVTSTLNHIYYLHCDSKTSYGSTANAETVIKSVGSYIGFTTAIVSGTTYTNEKRKVNIVDLTLALGSTIADYVYGLEQSTAGSGVAWLKEHFPKMFGQYNPYDSGSIQSVSGLVSHTTKDSDDNVLGSYPLDSTLTLRGIPKLDNGKLYYDGDTYGADGSVSRKYGVVDLGTLEWTYQTSGWGAYPCFWARLTLASVDSGVVANILCPKYTTVSANTLYSGADKSIAENSPYIRIRDTAYTDATALKSAMSGVYLVYELATPTTETAQPFTKTQLCDSGGTEEFVTSGIVSVGHKSKYAEK